MRDRSVLPDLIATTPLPIARAFSANAATDSSTPVSVAATAASASPANISTTLASAWDKALSANPGLRAAQFGAAATEGAILQAKARPNPELSFTQEDTRSSTRTSTVQINQVIELGGKAFNLDGNWREDKMSEADYMKLHAETDERYTQILAALLGEAKK